MLLVLRQPPDSLDHLTWLGFSRRRGRRASIDGMVLRWTLGLVACVGGATTIGVVSCSGQARSSANPTDASTDVRASGADAACVPAAVDAAFVFTPPNPQRSACTAAQIQTANEDCNPTLTTAACRAFLSDPANALCIDCALSLASNRTWGALVDYPNDIVYANVSGCVATVSGDSGPGSCAYALQALQTCTWESCETQCPSGATPAGVMAFNQCTAEAESSICARQAQAASCLSDYPACHYASFEAYVLALGAFFCSAAADAGVDGTVADAGVDWD